MNPQPEPGYGAPIQTSGPPLTCRQCPVGRDGTNRAVICGHYGFGSGNVDAGRCPGIALACPTHDACSEAYRTVTSADFALAWCQSGRATLFDRSKSGIRQWDILAKGKQSLWTDRAATLGERLSASNMRSRSGIRSLRVPHWCNVIRGAAT